jgi:PhnB protein
MSENYKPTAYPSVIPYLVLSDADRELDFVKAVFGAKEMRVSRDPQGKIGHAEIRIGDSVVMLGQSSEQWPPSPAAIYVYVPDTDAAYERALKAGAASTWAPADQPYGDRNAGVKDSNGMQWWIATHLENVSEQEEARRRAAAAEKSRPTLA